MICIRVYIYIYIHICKCQVCIKHDTSACNSSPCQNIYATGEESKPKIMNTKVLAIVQKRPIIDVDSFR